MTRSITRSMTARRVLRLVAFSVVVVAPATAAPPYAPDDQYQAFTDEDTEISDRQTGLKWQRDLTGEKRTQELARADCGLISFSGRLPTIKELLTLVNEEPDQVYENAAVVTKLIDRNAFGTSTPVDDVYWSDTPGWVIDFATGITKKVPETEPHYFRCVKP